ncbi:hypothetical protein HNP65_000982 [Thermosipho japonicus]|uniref:DNA-binding protein n=1 Tax=Thermosipho japonicus TaxID=90323 RepID=A0A841GN07_9BACT|nr:hypothetical protein [Thermosipho japonicus]MBB6062544.1 hypothetical protein [Thermosipho japonicus]
MRKLVFLLVSIVFISALFAFPYNYQTAKSADYKNVWEKLKNVEVSEPATYTGTIKEVYIVVNPGFSKSKIILETDEGSDVEIFVGPMWRFFEFKPGEKVELEVVKINFSKDSSFYLAYKLTSDGITVEIPYKQMIKERIANLKRLKFQNNVVPRFQRRPEQSFGSMMPHYGSPYENGYPPMSRPRNRWK